jgi:hypothetical protein
MARIFTALQNTVGGEFAGMAQGFAQGAAMGLQQKKMKAALEAAGISDELQKELGKEAGRSVFGGALPTPPSTPPSTPPDPPNPASLDEETARQAGLSGSMHGLGLITGPTAWLANNLAPQDQPDRPNTDGPGVAQDEAYDLGTTVVRPTEGRYTGWMSGSADDGVATEEAYREAQAAVEISKQYGDGAEPVEDEYAIEGAQFTLGGPGRPEPMYPGAYDTGLDTPGDAPQTIPREEQWVDGNPASDDYTAGGPEAARTETNRAAREGLEVSRQFGEGYDPDPEATDAQDAKEAEELRAKREDYKKRQSANVIVLPGNYNHVTQPDGKTANVKLSTMESDGKHYAIPTMWDGKEHNAPEAWQRAVAYGLDYFGPFKTDAEAQKWIDENHGNIVGTDTEPEVAVVPALATPQQERAAETLADKLRAWNPDVAKQLTDDYWRGMAMTTEPGASKARRMAGQIIANRSVQAAHTYEASPEYTAHRESLIQQEIAATAGRMGTTVKDLHDLSGDDLLRRLEGIKQLEEQQFYATYMADKVKTMVPEILSSGEVDDRTRSQLLHDASFGVPGTLQSRSEIDAWAEKLIGGAYMATDSKYSKEEISQLQIDIGGLRKAAAQEQKDASDREGVLVEQYGGDLNRALKEDPFGFEKYIPSENSRKQTRYNMRQIMPVLEKGAELMGITKKEVLANVLDDMEAVHYSLANPHFINWWDKYIKKHRKHWVVPHNYMPSMGGY